jgi:NAD(P)-dependent dehydrogenase (short-subunit alcohol dehydrogenase family)
MKLDLQSKVILVTGSSRGIGYSIAQVLSDEGSKVILNGRDLCQLELAAKNLPNAFVIAGDVSDPVESNYLISKVKEKYGRLDGLVCNVGSGSSVSPGCETYEEWQRAFSVNFFTATNMVESAQDLLAESEGAIVCISSICGLETIQGAPVTYSVTKAGLNAYVKGIARPLGKKGIRINAVAPGNILFEGSVWDRKMAQDKESVKNMLDKEVALSRLGNPFEVADLVAYLLSSKAGFATGSIWTLDGGQVRN